MTDISWDLPLAPRWFYRFYYIKLSAKNQQNNIDKNAVFADNGNLFYFNLAVAPDKTIESDVEIVGKFD